MAVPTYEPHVLIAFGGTMVGSPEIWGCGIRCQAINGPYTVEVNQAACDGYVKNAVENLILDTQMLFSSDVELGYIKVNNIAADGKYADETTAAHYETVPVQGGQTPGMPYQVSVVATFVGTGRGQGSRGRIYLPSQALEMQSGGRLAGGLTGPMVAGLVTFFHALEAPAELGYKPGIFSSKGPWSLVNTIEVGDIPDTQRRRRNALIEERAASAV